MLSKEDNNIGNTEFSDVVAQIEKNRESFLKKQKLYESALNLALTCNDFSPSQLDYLKELINSMSKYLLTTFELLLIKPDFDININSPSAIIVADVVVDLIINNYTYNFIFTSYIYEWQKFFRLFPNQANRVISSLISMEKAFTEQCLEIFSQYLTADVLKEIIPYDLNVISLIIERGIKDSNTVCQLFDSLYDKELSERINTPTGVALILNSLPEDQRMYVINNYKKIFRSRKINIDFAITILNLNDPSEALVRTAIKNLIKAKRIYNLTLKIPIHIPEDMSGFQLCKLLCFLENCNIDRNIYNLPTEEDLRARTIEVQMSDIELFKSAIEARDRLETKIKENNENSICILYKIISDFNHSQERPEYTLLNLIKNNNHVDILNCARLMILCTLKSKELFIYRGVPTLWNEPMNEKMARELLVICRAIGITKIVEEYRRRKNNE